MRIKRRGIYIGLFTALTLCLLALLLLFLPADGTKAASAASTPKYSVYFDYKYYGGSSLSDREPTPQLNTEKNNVLKSDAHVCKKGVNQNTCEVKFELYGSSSDGSTGTLSQGDTIKSKTVNITASSEYNENAFQIKNASGGVVASSSSKSIQATLTNGTYYVTFTGNSRWEQESVARTVIRVAVIECTFSFKIDDHTHSYTATVTNPTCTTDGYTTYRCSCGDSYTGNKTNALGHSYSATTTPAACTSGGYTTNRCTRCGNTYMSNQSSPLGHSYSNTQTLATCTSGGYTTHKCTRCGSSYVDSQTPALGHSYEVEKSVTCTGEKFVYTCSRCHDSYTETTDKNGTGHSFTTKTTAATCTEGGSTVYTCTKCGYSYKDDISNALGHNYTVSSVSPTCIMGGYTLYVCSRCGYEYRSGETQANGHRYVSSAHPATCTSGGYTLHECEICGANYRDNETQPLGHNFIIGAEPPTCTEFGVAVYSCQVCGYETRERDGTYPTGHSFTNTIVRTATCTMDGLRKSVCEKCGETVENRIPALGHRYEITDSYTEEERTVRVYTCSVCGDSYTQELGNQYEHVTTYVEYLFEQYAPYMYWVLLATAGIWSIAIGVAIIIAVRNEDKAKAKKMLVNYLIGLVVIFCIIVACPYLMRGIASLIT